MLPGSSAAFAAHQTAAFGDIIWSGTSTTTNPVYAYSTQSGTQWYVQVDGTGTVDDAWIKDSNACASTGGGLTATTSVDGGNNTCWTFPGGAVSGGSNNWYSPGWALYDTITISATNIDDVLTDFPVYVDLADLSSTFWSTTPGSAGLVGTDIRVTTDDGSPVELPRELVFASSTAQTGELWFKANTIASTTDTVFRIYYNGTTTGDYLPGETYGANAVWTNGYDAVYHLNEDPGVAGTGGIVDSTGSGNDGTDLGSMTSADKVAGKTGYAFDFDGNDDLVYFTDRDYSSGPLTVSAWGKTSGTSSVARRLIDKSASDVNQTVSIVVVDNDVEFAVDNYAANIATTTTYADDVWHYYVNTSDTSDLYGYLDAVEAGNDAHDNSWNTNDAEWSIGGKNFGGEYWDGQIDEFRIASSTRSDAWVKAEYYNQATSTDFYTVNKTYPNQNFVHLSGTLYADEGTTGITTGKTIKLAVGTSTLSVQSTTTDSGLASFHFNISSSSLSATGTPIVMWVDGDSSTRGSLSTVLASTTADVSGLDIYQNHVIIRHEGSGQYSSTTLTAAVMSFYDSSDDSDIQFTASAGTPTSTVFTVSPGNELYVWAGDNFSPGGSVVINGGETNSEDGSFQLAAGAGYFGAAGSLTVAGNFVMDATSHFFPHASGTIFIATSTGHIITAPINSDSRHYDSGAFTFNGTGGGWSIIGNATTSDFDIQAGAVTSTGGTLDITGNYSNSGTFTHNNGTVTFGPGVGFDMSTVQYDSEVSFTSDITSSGQGIFFSPDGTKFYILDNTVPTVREYTLSTPWDLTSKSYVGLKNVGAQMSSVWSMVFTPDGKTLYLVSNDYPIYEYELSTAWSITTATYTGNNFTPTGAHAALRTIRFTPDGTRVYMGGSVIDTFDLSVPWKLSAETMTYSHSYDFTTQEDQLHGLDFNEDGTRVYVTGRGGDDINEYALSEPYYISTSSISFLGVRLVLNRAEPRDAFISSDGTKYFVSPNSYQRISIYSLKEKQQTATGTMTGASAFYNLSVDNEGGSGSTTSSVVFGAPVTGSGTFTIAASSSVAFNAGDTYTFGNVNWDGTSVSPVYLRSTNSGSQWYLTISGSQLAVDYVDVKDSDATATSGGVNQTNGIDQGNNINWNGFVGAVTASVWNDTDWTLYDTITIDHTNIDDDLTDFPVYVDLSDLSATFWSTTPSNRYVVGTDIRVTTDDGSPVELPRELVTASSTAQTGELWFKANSVSSTTDTVFRIYYNGDTVGDYATDATYGAENVWTNDFLAVYHLTEDPGAAGTNGILDSTAQGLHGTDSGTMTNTDHVVGKSGYAIDFDGTDDLVNMGTAAAFDFGAGTVTGWYRPDDTNKLGNSTIWAYTDGASTDGDLMGQVVNQGNPVPAHRRKPSLWSNNTNSRLYATSPVATSTWHYSAITFNGSNLQEIYHDGVMENSRNSNDSFSNSAAYFGIGADSPGSSPSDFFQGPIDEIHVATSTRSSAWIKAEYYNLATTTDFYTAGVSVTTGSSTIANHSDGQVGDAFTFQSQTDQTLFGFRLTPNSGTATTTNLVFTLSGAKKIDTNDFSNIRLYRDINSDAVYDGGDAQVATGGVMVLSGRDGTITLTTDFAITAAADYILVADWIAPANGSFLNISLYKTGVTVTDDAGVQDIYGSVSDVQHNRNNSGGGGRAAAIGGAAPDGDGDVSGGNQGGGNAVDTNTGGATIGNDANYQTPTAQSGNWTTGANAIDSTDGTYATDGTGSTHDFTNSNFTIAGTDQITGVEVKVELSNTTAAGDMEVYLSWDGGSSWTAPKNTPILTATDAVYSLGGPTDLWGRSWSPANFSNTNFVVQVYGWVPSGTHRLDAIQVRVYHQATGGGSGGGGGGGSI
ncbi:laminin G domain-containing protein [Candidatus Kaiserbacteria bacterium]|nr:laminin G domain-containing protein [Candidatus Kaiserbacteria bacterium]